MSSARALDRRRSGVLLHPTSLPAPDSQGRIGPEAMQFCDFLCAAGFSVSQTLPLNQRDDAGSPYRTASVFAIDPPLLDPAATDAQTDDADLAAFVADEHYWLADYAHHVALRREHGLPWYEWPAVLRDRDPAALAAAREHHAAAIETTCRTQFLCHGARTRLRQHAHARGIGLFGDLSFFVGYDSADVWTWRSLFQLDDEGRMTANTGVPPDYFSATGQLWGMPHYDWPAMRASGWRW